MTLPPDDLYDLLVAYALGALAPPEVLQAEELLEQHPELRHTLNQLRATVGQLPHALPLAEPAPALRQRILDRAAGRALPHLQPSAPVRRLRALLFGLGGLALATLLALVLVGGRLAGAQSELFRTQIRLATAEADSQRLTQLVVQAPLAELGGATGRAVVGHVASGETVLIAQLPALPQGQVYQLWLIKGSNAPQNGGVFTTDRYGYGQIALQPTAALQQADTFAITAEPGPAGSPGPTTPVLLAGTRRA